MTAVLIILALGFFFTLAIIALIVGIYNGLIRKRVACENAWSQIDVQLKRRYDLIPNLVETVKGYASHEQGTLEKVIAARTNAMNVAAGGGTAARGEAENMLSGTLKSLFALSEAYPDLKANTNFAKLQEELSSTENKISFSRQHYNDSVGVYNSALQVFPNNFVANFGGFTKREFFELDASEAAAVKQAPKVSF